MISKEHRFHGYGSLRFVYNRGQAVRSQYCLLKYAYNSRQPSYRIAVVVSRKVHKSAVVRNRIRRRIYEAIRAEGGRIDKPYDLVFIIYSDYLAEVESAELKKMVLDQLSKAQVLGRDEPRPNHAIVSKEEK